MVVCGFEDCPSVIVVVVALLATFGVNKGDIHPRKKRKKNVSEAKICVEQPCPQDTKNAAVSERAEYS